MADGITLRTLNSSITLGTRGWDSGMAKVNADTGKIGGWMKRNSAAVRSFSTKLLVAGVAITATLGLFTKFAMGAQESENLFEVSMGEMADSTRKWSEELSSQLGLNAFEVRKMTGIFNSMFDSMKFGADDAQHMSTRLVELANDMSSFFNLPIEVMFQKLQAGITGEIEPLKRLGIIVGQTNLEQTELFKTWGKSYAQLTENEKVLLRFNSILSQTQKAQGDLARTFDDATNVLRTLGATAKNIAIEIGNALIPVVEGVGIPMREFLTTTLEWIKENPALVSSITLTAAAFGILTAALASLALATIPVTAFITFFTVGAGTKFGASLLLYVTSPLWAANVAMIALGRSALVTWGFVFGPVTAVILAIAGIAAAIYTVRILWRRDVMDMKAAWKEWTDVITGGSLKIFLNSLEIYFKNWFEQLTGYAKKMVVAVKDMFVGMASDILRVFSGISSAIGDFSVNFSIDDALKAFDKAAARDPFADLSQGLKDAFGIDVEEITKGTKNVFAAIEVGFDALLKKVQPLTTGLNNIASTIAIGFDKFKDDASESIRRIGIEATLAGENFTESWKKAWPEVVQQMRLDLNSIFNTEFFKDAFTLEDFRQQAELTTEKILKDAADSYADFKSGAAGNPLSEFSVFPSSQGTLDPLRQQAISGNIFGALKPEVEELGDLVESMTIPWRKWDPNRLTIAQEVYASLVEDAGEAQLKSVNTMKEYTSEIKRLLWELGRPDENPQYYGRGWQEYIDTGQQQRDAEAGTYQANPPITVIIQNNLGEEKLSRAVLGSPSGQEGVVYAVQNDLLSNGPLRQMLSPQPQ